LVSMASECIVEGISLDDFRKQVKREFKAWFPLEGWGPKKFSIQFAMGKFTASFLRTEYMDSIGDDFRITLSQDFNDAYNEAYSAVKKLREGRPETESWRAHSTAYDMIERPFSNGESFRQWYIPAGRSFFTTLGKASTAFQSGLLDPLTTRFGSLFTSLLEQRSFARRERTKEISEFEEISQHLLGGRIKTSRNEVSFETSDGRELPLRFLSSGIQELVPLMLTLSWFLYVSGHTKTAGWTLYIEEPEAHLFPETQNQLVRILALLSFSPSSWVITTHSPYILTAFNNLILAGQLARDKPKMKEEIAGIIPEKYWIGGGGFKAYCIHDGMLSSIISESGLIDGEYLDSVSNTIGDEFDSLLKLEYHHANAT